MVALLAWKVISQNNYWFAVTKGQVGRMPAQCHKRRTKERLTKVIKNSVCMVYVQPTNMEKWKLTWSYHCFPHLWRPVDLQWGIHVLQHYYNITLYIFVDRPLLLTQSVHILHWHSQAPEKLFFISIHVEKAWAPWCKCLCEFLSSTQHICHSVWQTVN